MLIGRPAASATHAAVSARQTGKGHCDDCGIHDCASVAKIWLGHVGWHFHMESVLQPDPVEAAAKLVSLPGSVHLCHYATSLPLTIGRGASHAQQWAAGDHLFLADEAASEEHLLLHFEPHSRAYELHILGHAGARVDGYDHPRSAVIRLGSGSCVRVGSQEFCAP